MVCKEWLREYLTKHEFALVEQLKADAAENGFLRRELKAAKKEIGVKVFHQFDEYGATSNWFWYLQEERLSD